MKINNSNQSKKADYGQDMPGIIITAFIAGIVLTALAIWQYQRYYTGESNQTLVMVIVLASFAILLFTLAIVGMWSSRFGKLILRDKVLGKLNFKGSESTLDLGCGKGLLLIEAAKRTPDGKATGADLWDKTLEYSYTAQMALNNAKIEGVSERVEVVTADAQAMPFADNSFDTVMTSLMMHHVSDTNKALNEMIRVTKPGGTIVIADVNSKRFVPMLKSLGLSKVESYFATRLFFIPAYVIMGVKSK
jgi:arsenite methyltransferase